MDQLVKYLSDGMHPVRIILKPEETMEELKKCFQRKFLNLEFLDTKGGTELGINLADQSAVLNQILKQKEEIEIEGQLFLNFSRVKLNASIRLNDFHGMGKLEVL